jgi:hypothetical protein
MDEMNKKQPPPQRTEAPSTMRMVMADIEEREKFGKEKYGTVHQFDNGRDHLIDLYQELLDAVCYVRAEIERRKHGT